MEEITNFTQGQRLQTILRHYNLKQVALSQRLGIGKAYVSQMINDQSPITSKVVSGLIKSFPKLNSNWLLTGNGQMFIEDDVVKNYQLDEGVPRTLAEMEAEYSDDPFRGLRDMYGRLSDLEKRVAELEEKLGGMGL